MEEIEAESGLYNSHEEPYKVVWEELFLLCGPLQMCQEPPGTPLLKMVDLGFSCLLHNLLC